LSSRKVDGSFGECEREEQQSVKALRSKEKLKKVVGSMKRSMAEDQLRSMRTANRVRPSLEIH
jgi:hypothetical protein